MQLRVLWEGAKPVGVFPVSTKKGVVGGDGPNGKYNIRQSQTAHVLLHIAKSGKVAQVNEQHEQISE